ncbi:hypothetical protein BGY98DRAFT_1096667 [Russula aff. rugulosa BPL654]|nr:hypothetical protein BGY98DRAFT_1096667 [Russula aff. rugulosa BPL654]
MLMGYPISFLAWPVSEAKSSAISSNVLQLKFVPEYDWHARTTEDFTQFNQVQAFKATGDKLAVQHVALDFG